MAAQYDDIAEPYQKLTRTHKVSRIVEHTFLGHLGDVSGKSVLDLACGEGYYTRKMRRGGASRVVGVDISGGMLELAIKQELEDPLGIEYVLSAAEDLGKIADFDVVTAVYLLNYAQTKEQLLKMCQTACDNLKPGERFVAINCNLDAKVSEYPPDAFEKYGCSSIQVSQPLQEGAGIKLTMVADGEKIQFDNYYLSKETYEWVLEAAGFRAVHWQRLMLPPEIEQEDGRDFWDFFIEAFPAILIECEK
jgi:2-polyprenyl-3-methyl-5-hydroxy-6-metoxy-1,4-benzoquinol methylase